VLRVSLFAFGAAGDNFCRIAAGSGCAVDAEGVLVWKSGPLLIAVGAGVWKYVPGRGLVGVRAG
jgi:hypothetical protein